MHGFGLDKTLVVDREARRLLLNIEESSDSALRRLLTRRVCVLSLPFVPNTSFSLRCVCASEKTKIIARRGVLRDPPYRDNALYAHAAYRHLVLPYRSTLSHIGLRCLKGVKDE